MTALAEPVDQRIEVPKVVSEEQVRFFVDNGYLVVPDLITPAEVEELRRDILHLARGGYPADGLERLPRNLDDEALARSILCIHQPHFVSPVMRKYVSHPLTCGVLSQIVAAHLPWWDGSVK